MIMTAGDAFGAMHALPHGDLDDILDGGTPIILAPHPDDEVIGCGGLLAAAVRAGVAPVIIFITDGSGSHPNSLKYPRDALIALRQSEARTAAHILGIDQARIHFMGIRDTAAPHDGQALAEAADAIAETIAAYARPVMFAPWMHDPHGDHQAVHKMAVYASRKTGIRHVSYLVWGWVLPEGQALDGVRVSGWRFHLNGTADQKARALDAYQSQLSNLIDDDPAGFRLDSDTLAAMLRDDEVFLVNA
jgi:LmbE family N-acetylglucosaminyl deacetylase